MPSDPQRVQAIFIGAVQKSEFERVEFLDRECGGDSELRRRVDALLAAHDQSGSFLDSPPKDLAGTSPTVAPSMPEQAGSLIGPYKLLQQIGEGGMGSVYMAEQIEPVERRVALKIIKPGMDTKVVIARFEAERQALAMMDHPNIAKVLDVGMTNSDRPFFVMELVRGVPITQYCDEHQLTPRERLELFLPVCQAVQHAHQKGIIHRDIKPSNVLVAEYDDHAVPKIIDFGLAKAMEKRLTAKTMFTEFGQIVGTPDYMSPEQAKLNQMDIDTRSDIYSLGVLLYELLSGNTPFDRQRMRSAAFDELLRIIREEEPPKPSQRLSTVDTLPSIAASRHITPAELTRQLCGELDWIVMKTLEKDRTRRYDTANGLANDLRRYLNDEPVEACPPSAAYRFRKFARRNKGPFTAATAVALLLLVASIVATLAAVKFNRLADDNAALASDRIAALDIAEKNLHLATVEQERAAGNLDLALAALDAVYLDAIGRDKLLGEPLAKPGNMQWSDPIDRPQLTDLERNLLKQGLEFYDRFAEQNTAAPRAFVQTGQAYYRVALLQTGLGEIEDAEVSFQAAIARFEQMTKGEPDNADYCRQLADAYTGLANVVPDWKSAASAYAKAESAYTQAIALQPTNSQLYNFRSRMRALLSDHRNALDDAESAIRLAPENVAFIRSGAFLYRAAPPPFRDRQRSLELMELALAVAPDNALALVSTGEAIEVLRPGEGLHLIEKAIDLHPGFWKAYHARAQILFDVKGDLEGALSDLDQEMRLRPNDPGAFELRGRIHVQLEAYEEAKQDFATALRLRPHRYSTYRRRGEMYTMLGEHELATEDFNRVVEIHPSYWLGYKRRAVSSFHLHDYNGALDDLKTALKLNRYDTSTFVSIPLALVAKCNDESFKSGMIALADQLVENSDQKGDALVVRSQLLIALGNRERALQDLEQATVDLSSAAPSCGECYQRYSAALLYLQLGDIKKYRESLHTMQQRFATTEDPNSQNFVGWTACLVPDAVDDYSTLLALAEKAVAADPENDQYQKTLAGLRFRAGDLDAARELLLKIAQRDDNSGAKANLSPAYGWYFLAMTQQALGNPDEARTYHAKANEWTNRILSDAANPPAWNHKLTLELLRDEATEDIENSVDNQAIGDEATSGSDIGNQE